MSGVRDSDISLAQAAAAFGTPTFEAVFKQTIMELERHRLPLQAGLSQSSYVDDSAIDVVVLSSREQGTALHVKAGIFYGGIIAGSCCADDPTPVEAQPEYCELLFTIHRQSGAARVELLAE